MRSCFQGRWADFFIDSGRLEGDTLRQGSLTPCSKKEHVDQGALDVVLSINEHLQHRDHNFSKRPVLVFDYPCCYSFYMCSKGFSCISICFLSYHWILVRNLCLHLLYPLSSFLYAWIRSPWVEPSITLSRPISQPLLICQKLQSLNHLCGSFWTFSSKSIFIWFLYILK